MSEESKSAYSESMLRIRQRVEHIRKMTPSLRKIGFNDFYDYYAPGARYESAGSSANRRDNVQSDTSAFNVQNHGTARDLTSDFIAETNADLPVITVESEADPLVNLQDGHNTFSDRAEPATPSTMTFNTTVVDPEGREAWLRSFTPSYHDSDRDAHLKWQNGEARGPHDQSNQYDYSMRHMVGGRTQGGDTPSTYTQTPVQPGFHQNNQIGPGTNNMVHNSEATEQGIHIPVQTPQGQTISPTEQNLRPPMAPTNNSGTGAHPATTGPSGAQIPVDGSWGYDMVYQQQPTLSSIPPAADIPVQEWGPAPMGITTPAHYAYHNTSHRHSQISYA